MKSTATLAVIVALFAMLHAVTIGSIWSRPDAAAPAADGVDVAARLARVEQGIAGLERAIAERAARVVEPGESSSIESAPASGGLELDELVARLDALTRAVEAIDMSTSETAVDPSVLESEDGYTIAEKWIEDGKLARGAEGLLRFLSAHPDHPDARDLQVRARDALWRAGYRTKAIDLQKDLLERYEASSNDYMHLGNLQKSKGDMSDAIASVEQAIALERDPSQRLWHELYRAWYIELRDGAETGLGVYRTLEQEIERLGFGEVAQGDKVRRHIENAQRSLGAG